MWERNDAPGERKTFYFQQNIWARTPIPMLLLPAENVICFLPRS